MTIALTKSQSMGADTDVSLAKFEDEVSLVSKYKWQIVWPKVIFLGLFHIWTLKLLPWILFSGEITFYDIFIYDSIARTAALGLSAGIHRLWSHRSYKARLPLAIFLMMLQSLSLQGSILHWARDHRLHHKFSDTDADPHNSRRGFFFSHIGWLFVRKHREVIRQGNKILLDDLLQDPVVSFQHRYYILLVVLFWGLGPTVYFSFLTGHTYYESFLLAVVVRYVMMLNQTWTINSLAHKFGERGYDQSEQATDNRLTNYFTCGDGSHNYHHVFPYDYSSSELGWTRAFNMSTLFLDVCSALGLAHDLKKPSVKTISARIKRTGDEAARTRFYSINVWYDYVLGAFLSNSVVFFFIVARISCVLVGGWI